MITALDASLIGPNFPSPASSQKNAHIDTAFILWGTGKVWMDMDFLKFEIIR